MDLDFLSVTPAGLLRGSGESGRGVEYVTTTLFRRCVTRVWEA